MPLNNFYKQIVKLQQFNVLAETADILGINGEFIAELLREQLRAGKDGRGKNVTVFGRDYYSDATVFEKERHGQGFGKFTDWITNYMSGRFYNSIRTEVEGTTFKQISDVDYFPEILRRSGSVIMELDIQSLNRLHDEILLPELKLRFNAKVNGL